MLKGKTIKTLILAFILLGCGINQAEAKIFGKNEVESSDMGDFKKWAAVLASQKQAEEKSSPGLAQWKAEIEQFRGITDEREIIEKVNNYINKKIRYKSDQQIWGVADKWSSPAESFKLGTGDCEDFAIAKYFTLKALGFDESKMRIVIVHELRKGEIHSVLLVDEGGSNYILDNQSASVKEDTQIAYYSPIYSINKNNWWKNT